MKRIFGFLCAALLAALLTACSTPADTASATAQVDVDLSLLSDTMAYAEVVNMVRTPDDYLGKTVKIAGRAVSETVEATGMTYYAIFIDDATACCSQGLEYLLRGDAAYPLDGQTATVTGVFETYQEGDRTYLRLKDASLSTDAPAESAQ